MEGTDKERERTRHEMILGAINDLTTQVRSLKYLSEEICGNPSAIEKKGSPTTTYMPLAQFLNEASETIGQQAREIFEATKEIRDNLF